MDKTLRSAVWRLSHVDVKISLTENVLGVRTVNKQTYSKTGEPMPASPNIYSPTEEEREKAEEDYMGRYEQMAFVHGAPVKEEGK